MLPTRVIAEKHSPAIPTTKPLKPLCQLLSAWKTIPRISRLVTLHKSGGTPSTTLFQRRGAVSNIASIYTDPKTRVMRIARKRSDRTSPSKQAGVQLFQPLFCGAQERDGGLCSILYLRPINRCALQASVRDNFAGTDPAADSPQGLVAFVDLRTLSFHIQIALHHMRFLRFALEGTAYEYPVLLLELALAPRTFSKWLSTPLRASRMHVLII